MKTSLFYDTITDFIAIRNEGKWGFIAKDGKLTINYQFEKIVERFINGKAVVSLNGKTGLIDENGKYIINPQFTSMQNDGENYLIEQDGKFGWCDKDGKIIINPQFEKAFPFAGNDLAAVKSGKSYGYINKEGKIIINPQFDVALPYNGKLALVQSGGKIGFIDKEGKYVINPQFDDVSQDLVSYMFDGSSQYSSVKTEYFNISAIVSRINVLKLEGLTMTSKISEVSTKFKKSEADFSQYSNEHLMISNEKITNDASFSFYVIARPFQDVPDGWYTKKVLNTNAVVNGFAYVLNLHEKGNDKEDVVKAAIENSLTGYTKDATLSNENEVVYKNATQSVKIFIQNKNIVVVISLSEASDVVEEVAD